MPTSLLSIAETRSNLIDAVHSGGKELFHLKLWRGSQICGFTSMYPGGRHLRTIDVHFRCRRYNPHRSLNLDEPPRIKECPNPRKYPCAPFQKINVQHHHKPISQTILADMAKDSLSNLSYSYLARCLPSIFERRVSSHGVTFQ